MKPSASSYKVATAVLARGHVRLRDYLPLIRRNNSIFKTLAHQDSLRAPTYSVDHHIFHEGNINFWQRFAISACALPHRLIFRDITRFFLASPLSLPSSPWCHETALSSQFSQGYKTMCRFWFDGFLSYLGDYDYIVRVDDDCYLSSFPLASIIKEMKSGAARYVTAKLEPKDDPDVTLGLYEFASAFRESRPNLHEPSLDRNPYTNFFALSVGYFANCDEFKCFADAVHSSCCISINRWGDMPLWGVFLSMLEQSGLLSHRSDIAYYHGSHFLSVNTSDGAMPVFRNSLRWRCFLCVDSIISRACFLGRIKCMASFSLIRRFLFGCLR